MAEKSREIKALGDYQRMMERFEICGDGLILPDLFLVLRLDAHRYGDQWRDFPESGYPFDPGFVQALLLTAQRLMCSGFRIVYSFVHGDEISVLLDPSENANQRRRNKLVSLISSVTTVSFCQEFDRPAVFHVKLSELPTADHVVDYFMWQRKVASRNFFARTLGLLLAAEGLQPKEVDAKISKLTDEQRIALSAEMGRPLGSVSAYERFGAGLWWEEVAAAERGGGAPCQLVESSALPPRDEEYLQFMEARVEGVSFIPDSALGEVPLRKVESPLPQAVQERAVKERSPEKFRLGGKRTGR